MIPTTHDRLTLTCLTPGQREGTCGYWYLLKSRMSPYTAFRTREALEFFLDLHHLELEGPLPEQIGTHAWIGVDGATREVMHGEMNAMPRDGQRILKMSNGDYTLGIVEKDEQGVIIHFVGPNGSRPIFDHTQARAHEDAGHRGPMEAVIQAMPSA